MKIKSLLFMCYLVVSTLSLQNDAIEKLSGNLGAWVDLGTANVSHVANNAGIDVKAPADNYKKLKITARNTPFVITKLTVTYNTGEPQIIESRYDIAKNGESPMIDLDGAGRTIKHIAFSFDSKDFVKGNAEVTFFVRK